MAPQAPTTPARPGAWLHPQAAMARASGCVPGSEQAEPVHSVHPTNEVAVLASDAREALGQKGAKAIP